MIYLISKSDFPASMSVNVREERLLEHIENAQLFDIRPLLTQNMYSDLIEKITHYRTSFAADPLYTATAAEQSYLYLLNGKSYNSPTIEFQGLKKAIMYYAYARFIRDNDLRINEGGNAYKTTEFSERPSYRSVDAKANDMESLAYGSWNDSAAYLTFSKEEFEYWQVNTCGTTPGKRKNSGIIITGIPSNYK